MDVFFSEAESDELFLSPAHMNTYWQYNLNDSLNSRLHLSASFNGRRGAFISLVYSLRLAARLLTCIHQLLICPASYQVVKEQPFVFVSSSGCVVLKRVYSCCWDWDLFENIAFYVLILLLIRFIAAGLHYFAFVVNNVYIIMFNLLSSHHVNLLIDQLNN